MRVNRFLGYVRRQARCYALLLVIVLVVRLAFLTSLIQSEVDSDIVHVYKKGNDSRQEVAPPPPHTTVANDTEIDSASYQFTRGPQKVNPYPYDFVVNGSTICSSSTYMAILVHSHHPLKDKRDAIRETWGSVSKGLDWPGRKVNQELRLIFVLGLHVDKVWNQNIQEESLKHNDIIMGNFLDSYRNMTLKSLLGIKWITKFCSSARYLLKTDDDMIINLPHLLGILAERPMTRAIMGPHNAKSRVYRKGKWALPIREFPFKHFPAYESGAAYVISSDILLELYQASEYVPWIFIDDVYITGILAQVINATHVLQYGFAYWNFKVPEVCDIVQDKIITGTKMTPEKLREFWKLIGTDKVQCASPSTAAPN